MDLRTIMNSDAGGASNPPAKRSSSPPRSDQSRQLRVQTQQVPSYSPDYAGRPPQPPPPPLQHPSHASPDRSSSYGPVQSPYQQFNSGPTLNSAVVSHRSQSPPHTATSYGPGARDPYAASAVYNSQPQHASGPLTSPYTPKPMSAGPQHPEQQTYFAQQRSHSLQSVMTNARASNDPFHPRDSPPSATSQTLPSQQFPPSAHRAVPETPLGPPTFSSHHTSTPARRQSSGHDSPHNRLSSPRLGPDAPVRDPAQIQSPVTRRQSSLHGPPSSDPTLYLSTAGLKQEPTESASPGTVSRQNSTLRSSEDRRLNESPVESVHQRAGSDPRVAPVAPGSSQMNSSPSVPGGYSYPQKMEVDREQGPRGGIDAQPPQPKRRRYNEPPIYARRSVHAKGKSPMILNRQPPIPKHARRAYQGSGSARRRSSSMPGTPATGGAGDSAAPPPNMNVNGPSTQPPPANTPQQGPLGPWEPSITGFIPHEEITKLICDFLFQHVVLRNDVNAGPAGSAAGGQGAIVEVEAKLGHVMDMERGERLHLPILTETIVNRDDPRFRTSFESNMNIEQHRAMNNFLNEAVKASMPHTDPNRIPLSYAHKKERDTFYEISPSELPPIIRHNLNPRHKPRVRVTTDQRTGEVIAKIVKCRVADIDVSSPRTNVDWRVSVNLEMEYDGDVRNLPVVDAAVNKGGRGERNKDRMSYRHLAYQIDLTQVARAEPPTKNDFEHELEIEISAAEIRRQGHLAMAGDPKNQYEDLIKGFVDNVRVLARAVPP